MTNMTNGAGYAHAELSAMPALSDAPELYAPLPAADDPMSRAQRRDDTDFGLRAAGAATALASRLMGAPPDMAKGLTRALLERFDEDSAALAEGAPTPQAESDARDAIGRARGRLLDWALPQEAARQAMARERQLFEALDSYRQAAQHAPLNADVLYAEGQAALDDASQWLSPVALGALKAQWKEKLYGDAGAAWVNAEPENAQAALSSGVFGEALSSEKRASLILKAQQRLEWAARDREEQADADRRDRGVTWLQERENFRSGYRRKIESGQAVSDELVAARESGTITAKDAEELEQLYSKKVIADQQRFESLQRVMAFIDEESDQRPSDEDINAYFVNVATPVLRAIDRTDRPSAIRSYREKFGVLPEAVISMLAEDTELQSVLELDANLLSPQVLSLIGKVTEEMGPDPLDRETDPKLKAVADLITGVTPIIGEGLAARRTIDLLLKARDARRRGDDLAADQLYNDASIEAIGVIPIFGVLRRLGKAGKNTVDVLSDLASGRGKHLSVPEELAGLRADGLSRELQGEVDALVREKQLAQERMRKFEKGSAEHGAADLKVKQINMRINNKIGSLYESQALRELKALGFEVEIRHQRVVSPITGRHAYVDLIIKRDGKPTAYVEAKSRDGLYAYSENQTLTQMQFIRSKANTEGVSLVVIEAGGIIKVYTPEGKWIKGLEPPAEVVKRQKFTS